MSDLQNSLSTLKDKLSHENARRSALNQQLMNVQADLANRKAKIQEYEDALRVLENDKKLHERTNRDKIEMLAKKVSELEEECNNFRASFESQQQTLQEKEKLIQSLSSKLRDLNSENASLNERNLKLKADNQKLQASLSELENSLKERSNDTESNKMMIQKRLDDLHSEKSAVENDLRIANKELLETKKQRDDALQQLESAKREASSLESQLGAKNAEIQKLQKTVSDLTIEKNVMQQNVYEAEAEKNEAIVRAERIQSDYNSLAESSKNEISSLRTKIETLKKSQTDSESKRTEQLTLQIEQLNQELEQNKKTVAALQQELDEVKNEYSVASVEFEAEKTKHSALVTETEGLKKIIKDHQSKDQQMVNALNTEVTNRTALEKELAQFKEQVEQLKKTNADLEERNRVLVEKTGEELSNQRRYYDEKLKELQGGKDRKMNDAANLQAKIVQLEEAIKEKDIEIERLNTEVNGYENQIMTMTQTFQNHFNDYEKKLTEERAKQQNFEKKLITIFQSILKLDVIAAEVNRPNEDEYYILNCFNEVKRLLVLYASDRNKHQPLPGQSEDKEQQEWKNFVKYINEKAIAFFAYLGVHESDLNLSPQRSGHEFRDLSREIIKRFELIEENLKQYGQLQDNFQKLFEENQILEQRLFAKEEELNGVLQELESQKARVIKKSSYRSNASLLIVEHHNEFSNSQ